METTQKITIEVTARELALLTIIRTLGHGTLEKIGVQNGEPGVIIGTTQRIDLSRPSELDAVLDDGAGRIISMEKPVEA